MDLRRFSRTSFFGAPIILKGLDILTTEIAFNRGFEEGNPVMSFLMLTHGRLFSYVVGFSIQLTISFLLFIAYSRLGRIRKRQILLSNSVFLIFALSCSANNLIILLSH